MPLSLQRESTVPKKRVTTVVLPALAILFLTLGLISRQIKRMPLGLDDWTLILGLVFVLACAGLKYACEFTVAVLIHPSSRQLTKPTTYYEMGQHMVVILQEGLDVTMFSKVLTTTPYHLPYLNFLKDKQAKLSNQPRKLLFIFEPVYITAVAIIKFSVLLIYNRIFPVRPIRIGSFILGGITLAWLISIDLVAIFQCTRCSIPVSQD
ncbi:uncharacterized protein BDV14DRAFT_206321 [Aspergillus stella-maris]|uniref:uncharacterized protein n=1 Tax=Aspergillus stella-maris TaxID=1810926 RepID=UPI003CCD0BC0